MIPTKNLAAILAVLLLSFGAAYTWQRPHVPAGHPEDATIGAGNPTFDQLLQRFGDLAKAKGAAYAFDVLRQAQLPPGTDIHLVAHTIGHELYEQQGIDGMSVCTQEFGNGCSHSIVIEAMQQMGDGDSVRKLIDDACHKAEGGVLSAYTMCYHGLGHGVFAYYGYSFPETVRFCMKTGTAAYKYEQAYECIGGAAMELVSGGGHDKEAWQKANETYFSASDPLAPCDTGVIPAAAKSKCYVYLSPHYMAAAGANMEVFTDAQLTKGMGACAALPYGADRSACIGGFGKDFVGLVGSHDLRKRDAGIYSDQQMRDVEALCRHTPDQNDVYACISYALSMFFWGGFAEPSLSIRFCSVLSDAETRSFCYGNIADSIRNLISDPEKRAMRCKQLDARFQNRCLPTT